MPTRQAEATWSGDLKSGNGNYKGQSGALNGSYNFNTRFGDTPGTNPEELIGAAHAACFSMALAAGLGKAGHAPKRVHTTADVTISQVPEGFKITKILLKTEGEVPGIDENTFKEFAEKTKTGCPVSQALSATPIELQIVKFSG
jgi:osmotically inducible protein OsmC